jgi:hypothetical protein
LDQRGRSYLCELVDDRVVVFRRGCVSVYERAVTVALGVCAFECSGMSIPASDLLIGSSVLAVCRRLVQRFRADP